MAKDLRGSVVTSLVAFLIFAVGFGVRSGAETPEVLRCSGTGGATPDQQIVACTAAIRSGNLVKPSVAFLQRGNAYQAKSDYDHAIADYDEAIRLDPTYANAFNNRGNTYYRKANYDRAIADYNEAIRLDPKDANPFNGRGAAYKAKGDYDRAIADYSQAIRLNPNQVVFANNLKSTEQVRASAQARQQVSQQIFRCNGEDADQAIASCTELIYSSDYYDRKGALENRARAYQTKGDFERAIADYNEAVRLDPKSARAFTDRGSAYQTNGDLERAITDYDEAIRLDPRSARAFTNRGTAYEAKGNLERAIADYDEAIGLDPKDAFVFTSRGTAYEAKGDLERAIVDYNEAIRLDPKNKEALKSLARVALAAARQGPAPTTPRQTAARAANDIRIALVIGNSEYKIVAALPNPRRDAPAVAAALRDVGFQTVTLECDLSREKFAEALRAFSAEAEKADWAVIYFAGHGIEVGGINYLIPVDARLAADRDAQYEAMPLD
jgi:tetratricopeptide (TPR) repeat protein